MTSLVRIELLKLRTTRLAYGLLASVAGVSALFSVLFEAASTSGHAAAPITTAAGLDKVTTDTAFALLIAAVLGVTVASGEFRHGTATTTYLAFPHRGQVLTAKFCATAAWGALFGLLGGLVTTAAGLLLAAGDGGHVALPAGTLAGHIVGAAVGAGLLAAAGVGLGSLVRGQLGAVIGVFVWAVILEPVAGGFFPAVRPYLPFTAATSLDGANIASAFFGAGRLSPGGPGALPFAAATALLAGVAIALATAAAYVSVPRDIT